MKKTLALILTSLLLMNSCATPVERNFVTPSGSVETTVNTTIDEITNYMMNDLINMGYSVVSQSSNNITLERSLQSGEEFIVALTVGNSYSTNTRVSKIDFIETSNGTRVIWRQFWKAQMIGGQVNQSEIKNNAIFNSNMEYFSRMKESLESK